MNQNPPEAIIANILFMAFWFMLVVGILFAGQYFPSVRKFRGQMLSKWKPAAVIATVFLLGGRGFLNPYASAIFC